MSKNTQHGPLSWGCQVATPQAAAAPKSALSLLCGFPRSSASNVTQALNQDWVQQNPLPGRRSLRAPRIKRDEHQEQAILLGKGLTKQLHAGKNSFQVEFLQSNVLSCAQLGSHWAERAFLPSSPVTFNLP